MRRIVLSILLLWLSVWSWNMLGGDVVSAEMSQVTERLEEGEVRQDADRMVGVLVEANRCADVAVRLVNPLPTHTVRRYRTGGFSFDSLWSCLKKAAGAIIHPLLKTSLEFSQCHAARLKDTGYYVYALRKIVV